MAPGFPKLRTSVSALAATAAGLLALMGCSNDTSTAVGVTHPTLIEVAPQDFLGELTCSQEPSSVKRYVATLFDVTDEGAGGAGGAGGSDLPEWPETVTKEEDIPSCGGFQLPSSEPTSCMTSVGFGFVVSGRRYCAEVDAYDTDQIEPRGIGTRMMVAAAPDDAEPAAAAPLAEHHSRTACKGAVAAPATIVRARGCLPLFPQPDATAPGGVRVETEGLLGGLECGDEPGQVNQLNLRAQYRVTVRDEETGEDQVVENNPQPQVDCGLDYVFENIPGGTSVSIDIVAFINGSDASAGATCRAVTVPGATVLAECTPLSQLGTLRVDLEAALKTLDFACDDSVSNVRVTVDGVTKSFPPPDCLEPFDHAFLPDPVNEASVIVEIFHEQVQVHRLACHNWVEPGKLVVALCDCLTCP